MLVELARMSTGGGESDGPALPEAEHFRAGALFTAPLLSCSWPRANQQRAACQAGAPKWAPA